ncbi:YdhK family protein [Virgibacillus kimchii]
MKFKRLLIVFISLVSVSMLAACADENEEPNPDGSTETEPDTEENRDTESDSHADMNHSSSGEVPEGLEEAENPTYQVGSQAIIEADHMEGMEGAEATIVGAFDTVVYTVSFTPTTGGEEVTDHKWVIHEELENAGETPLEPGTEATMNADHMEGMEDAAAEIDSAEETTVYMVDFTTTDGDEVTNHKWVTEGELSAE